MKRPGFYAAMLPQQSRSSGGNFQCEDAEAYVCVCCVKREKRMLCCIQITPFRSAMGNIAAKEKRLQAISRKINYHSGTACTARGVVEKQRNNVLFTISNHLFFLLNHNTK
jgi:hypothetical protein